MVDKPTMGWSRRGCADGRSRQWMTRVGVDLKDRSAPADVRGRGSGRRRRLWWRRRPDGVGALVGQLQATGYGDGGRRQREVEGGGGSEGAWGRMKG